MTTAENNDYKTGHACLLQNTKLFFCVVNVHFTLAAKRYDKAAHGLLDEPIFVRRVPHNQVVARDSVYRLLGLLREYLTLTKLFDIDHHNCLVLHNLHLFLKVFHSSQLWLLSYSHF